VVCDGLDDIIRMFDRIRIGFLRVILSDKRILGAESALIIVNLCAVCVDRKLFFLLGRVNYSNQAHGYTKGRVSRELIIIFYTTKLIR
jgi:hypothetical protein